MDWINNLMARYGRYKARRTVSEMIAHPYGPAPFPLTEEEWRAECTTAE